MNKFLLLLSFGFLSMKVAAQNPNWSEHIAPILYNKCTQCHNQNGIAPFSLMTYQDAFDTHLNIQLNVNLRKMPPWPPDPNYRHFSSERILTAAEITAINDWVTQRSG